MDVKKFFVKDFIQYATPCFGCGKPNGFCLSHGGRIKAVITDKYVEADLHVRYSSTLTIMIFHKTNKILSNDNIGLANYLEKWNIHLESYCNCGCWSTSDNLKVDLISNLVKPTTLHTEYTEIIRDSRKYVLISGFADESSRGIIHNLNENSTNAAISFDMPLLPRYKLKDAQHLVDKLSTYATFS